MKNKLFKIFQYFSLIYLLNILLPINKALANNYAGFPDQTRLRPTVAGIFNFVFGAAGAIFVIMIIVGGLQYLTSAGNEEAATKAKKIMTYAVVGIVITVAAWGISDLILRLLGGRADWLS